MCGIIIEIQKPIKLNNTDKLTNVFVFTFTDGASRVRCRRSA